MNDHSREQPSTDSREGAVKPVLKITARLEDKDDKSRDPGDALKRFCLTLKTLGSKKFRRDQSSGKLFCHQQSVQEIRDGTGRNRTCSGVPVSKTRRGAV